LGALVGGLALRLRRVHGRGRGVSTRPWIAGSYDRTEDALHSVAATAMGFAFAAGVVAAALHTGRRGRLGGLAVDALAVAASLVVPLAMFAWPTADGALQRIMFAVAYLWYATAAVRIPCGFATRL
jgi:hypothetical protein